MPTCLTRFAVLGRRHDIGSPWPQPPNPPGGARRAVGITSQRVSRFDARMDDASGSRPPVPEKPSLGIFVDAHPVALIAAEHRDMSRILIDVESDVTFR